MVRSRTFKISCSAAFACLAAILAILPLSFPFPPITFLKFDVAEIPVVVAFLMFGTWPGMVSAVVYWFLLNFVGSWVPIGPALKFAAVISTLIGLWLGSGFKNAPIKGFNSLTRGLLMVTSGAIVRVLVMTLLNYVIIFLLFPFFSDIASKTLTSLGFKFRSSFEAMLWILVFIAIFNVLHTLLSVLLSLFIVRAVLKHLKFIPQPT